jgi:hypothetical protein
MPCPVYLAFILFLNYVLLSNLLIKDLRFLARPSFLLLLLRVLFVFIQYLNLPNYCWMNTYLSYTQHVGVFVKLMESGLRK